MLILQRKIGEKVIIGNDITVSVVSIDGGRVRLAIQAPSDVSIMRSELLEARQANQEAVVEEASASDVLKLLGSVNEKN